MRTDTTPCSSLIGYAIGIVAIAIASLSVHVVMLQWLDVGHPDFSSAGLWGLLTLIGQMAALIILYRIGRDAVPQAGPLARTILLAIFYMLATDGIRLPIMDGVTTLSVAFPAVTLLAGAATSLLTALLVVLFAPYLRSPIAKLAGAIAITAVYVLVIQRAVGAAVAPFAGWERPEVYTAPYGPGVLAISYTLFVATVAGVVGIVHVVAPRLSPRPLANMVQVALLLLLLRTMLVAQLVFPWVVKGSALTIAIGTSQYFLEDLALVLLAWALWFRLDGRRRLAAGPR